MHYIVNANIIFLMLSFLHEIEGRQFLFLFNIYIYI